MTGVLELKDVYAGYGDGHALFGVSLRVEPGEAVCLLGRNGAGKSTTLKSIMGLVPLAQGRVSFLERDLAGLRTYQRSRLGLGYVPEDRRIFPELSVRENLEAARKARAGDSAWTLFDPDGYRVQVCAEYGVYPGAARDFFHQLKKK